MAGRVPEGEWDLAVMELWKAVAAMVSLRDPELIRMWLVDFHKEV